MNIAGYQPLSLIDYPGVLSSIIFTQGCVFRCPYCHNPELIPLNGNPAVKEKEIFDHLHKRKGVIEGVVITGGEPTLQKDLIPFIQKLKQLGLLIKLDTNGVHPEVVRKIIDDHLVNFFAMDLKQTWEKYPTITRTTNDTTTKNCQETFRLIRDSGIQHEFRTTVCPGLHTEGDLLAIADMLPNGTHYSLQAIHYQKTLDPDLPDGPPIDLDAIVAKIQRTHPSLELEIRR